MTYTNIKNIIYWVFITFWIIFVFFYYFNLPILGDDWNIIWDLTNIYSIPIGRGVDAHMGRNFGELVTILPRAFSAWLSFIPEPLYRYKLMLAFVSTILYVILVSTSSLIIQNNKKISFLLFCIAIFYTRLSSRHDFMSITILPMLYISIFPAVYYLRNHTLPQWMIENPYKTFGYWAVFCYMGSQVYDPVYMMGTAFFGAFLLYLILLHFYPMLFKYNKKDQVSYKLTYSIAIFYIALSIFSAIRNIFSYRIKTYTNQVSFNIVDLYARISSLQLYINIVLLLSVIISLYIIYQFIKSRKIDGYTYVYIALTISSISAILLNGITNSLRYYIAWSSYMVVVACICYLWNKKNLVQIVLPTLILGLFVNILLKNYPNMVVSEEELKRMYLLRQADQEGATEIFINSVPRYDYNNLDIDRWNLSLISTFAQRMGYTKNNIKIIIVDKTTNQ